MQLYHFTSRYHLPFILDEGLTRGDVPLSKTTSTQAINLTTEGRAHHQKYNRTSYFIFAGQKHPLDKSEIRITIDIPDSEPLLIHWPRFTARMSMEPAWLQHLHRNTIDNGASWYLYFGPIKPEAFTKTEFNNNGNGKWVDIATMTEPIRLVTDTFQFATSSDVEGRNLTRIPQDEFVKRIYYRSTYAI